MAFLGLDDGLQSRSPLVNTIPDSVQPSIAGSSLSGRLRWRCCPGKPSAAAHPTRHSPPGWVQIGLFAGHKAGSMKSGTLRCRNSISVRQQVRFFTLENFNLKIVSSNAMHWAAWYPALLFDFPRTFPSPWIIFLAADEIGYEVNVGLRPDRARSTTALVVVYRGFQDYKLN